MVGNPDAGAHKVPHRGASAQNGCTKENKEELDMDMSSVLDLQGTDITAENVELPASFDSDTC